jgi:hypothetical protein
LTDPSPDGHLIISRFTTSLLAALEQVCGVMRRCHCVLTCLLARSSLLPMELAGDVTPFDPFDPF